MHVIVPDKNKLIQIHLGAVMVDQGSQLTFIHDHTVVQYAPEYTNEAPDFLQRLLSKWVVPMKGELLEEKTNHVAHLCKDVGVNSAIKIIVPCVKTLGPNHWCAERFMTLRTLENACETMPNSQKLFLHTELVKILSCIHLSPFGPMAKIVKQTLIPQVSLREYYYTRLDDIVSSAEYFISKKHPLADQLKLVNTSAFKFRLELKSAVSIEEKVVSVHGDFSPSANLLASDESNIAIIDFEQGLLGGDPLSDLWSLRLLSSSSRIKQYLDDKIKFELIQTYSKLSSTCPISLMTSDRRKSLIRFERLASALMYKLVIEHDDGTIPGITLSSYYSAKNVATLITGV